MMNHIKRLICLTILIASIIIFALVIAHGINAYHYGVM